MLVIVLMLLMVQHDCGSCGGENCDGDNGGVDGGARP